MSDKNDKTPKNIKVELGGMGLYGTTSNQEIAGYKATGDIENAGQLDKGFQKEEGSSGAEPTFEDHSQRD
ncbi:hypothetical protein GMD78_08790 [Ornithinibacillus sp. L9]|uniref:Uncharacterized protein n=1 Tax=Ornithinibacillus caprae TaxID=2678566 RepID=A0A6N8FKH6_9BACI|nr:hypothetical protein [Ornithinibacillus caprae]MUK88487.1 hypothetical protein [Ornithinibacillus caprae]